MPTPRPRSLFLLVACAALALAVGCASAPKPVPGQRTVLLGEQDAVTPEEDARAKAERRRRDVLSTTYDDARVGREASKEVASDLGLLKDEALDAYVTRIGQRLLRGVPRRGFRYRFAVVDQVEPNAFALPGGYIFVSRGLLALANSEDELANVIGHEITHVQQRHASAQQAAASAQNPLTMPWLRAANMAAYSRDMERDADRGGQLLAAAAGYDPKGMSTFLANLGLLQRIETGPRGPSFFDTHPTSVERASVNAVRANEIRWRRDPSRGDTHVAHLRSVEGLPVGPRREGGLFEGTTFLHPDLGFQMRFPEGWRLQNSNRAVGALSPHRDAVIYLSADLPPGELEPVARAFVEKETQGRAHVRDSRPVKLGTLDAWRLEIDAPGQYGSIFMLATFFHYREGTWRIAGMSPSVAAGKHRGRMLSTTRSFRPIDRDKLGKPSGTKLQIVEARAGEDVAALCERTGTSWNAVRTAVSNGVSARHRFKGGELVKVASTAGSG